MDTIKMRARAKINAFLETTGKLENGYHIILSHMQAVTLHDTLILTRTAGGAFGATMTCSDPTLACDGTNLVLRAAAAFGEMAERRGHNIDGTLTIDLTKRIPMAAGLAGGSADAAAVFVGMNTLYGTLFSTEQLCTMGARLGADIPFCIRATLGERAMSARGIGEQLAPAPALPASAHLVIACHGQGVSTPWAYGQLDAAGLADPEETERRYAAFEAALRTGDLGDPLLAGYNCFEKVVMPARPAVAALMAAMKERGACFARMSGSGPSVVGVFADADKARACAEALCGKGIRAVVCQACT